MARLDTCRHRGGRFYHQYVRSIMCDAYSTTSALPAPHSANAEPLELILHTLVCE